MTVRHVADNGALLEAFLHDRELRRRRPASPPLRAGEHISPGPKVGAADRLRGKGMREGTEGRARGFVNKTVALEMTSARSRRRPPMTPGIHDQPTEPIVPPPPIPLPPDLPPTTPEPPLPIIEPDPEPDVPNPDPTKRPAAGSVDRELSQSLSFIEGNRAQIVERRNACDGDFRTARCRRKRRPVRRLAICRPWPPSARS
jgi:hypothetical protein